MAVTEDHFIFYRFYNGFTFPDPGEKNLFHSKETLDDHKVFWIMVALVPCRPGTNHPVLSTADVCPGIPGSDFADDIIDFSQKPDQAPTVCGNDRVDELSCYSLSYLISLIVNCQLSSVNC